VRRLWLQIYLTVVGVLFLLTLLAALAWLVHPTSPWERDLAERLAATVGELLPAPDRPAAELQAAVERLATRLNADVAVFDRGGHALAGSGGPLAPPTPDDGSKGWLRHRAHSVTVTLPLPDGRVFVAGRARPAGRGALAFLVSLSLLAVAVALGSWPLVRRLTRRLERLRQHVEDLGRGDLGARAPVEGRDEVADLACSFNRAAERIETLVQAQGLSLAFASHELRSPLARLRVRLEMMTGDPALREGGRRDIAELDGIVDEVLEASRLETRGGLGRTETVDVLALAAEEAARSGGVVSGEPVEVSGDPRLLRRLLRNLLENARRHGDGEVEVRVERRGGEWARVRVLDRGPGVAEAERDRIFEPFHRPPGRPGTGEGHGLGLALVRQIARAHGGEARCLAREGGGTVLEVDLRVRPPGIR